MILFLDFDGVLHYDDVLVRNNAPVLYRAGYTLFQQIMDCGRHADLSAILVLRRTRFQSDRPGFYIDLINFEIDEFADAPAVGAAHLYDCLEPEVRAVRDELLVLGVFEEASADVVFRQLRELWQPKDFWRSREHADAEHPLERGHFAIDRGI